MPAEETGDNAAVLDDLDNLQVDPSDLEDPGDEGEPQLEGGAEATPEVESPTPAPAAPVKPAAQAPVETPVSRFAPVAELISKAGYNFSAKDDDGIAAELQQLFAVQLPALRQYAHIGQQFYPHRDRIQQFLTAEPDVASPSPQRPAAPSQAQSLLPTLPEYDPAWENMVLYDEQGNITGPKPGAMLDLPQKVSAYQQARTARAQTIVDQFDTLVPQLAQQGIEEKFNQLFESRVATLQQQQFVQHAVDENKDWMFALDANKNRQFSPLDGTPILTSEGMAYGRRVEYLQSVGVTDPQAQHFLALEHLGKLPAAKQEQSAAPALPPEVARQQKLIEQQKQLAARKNGRGGSTRNQLPGKLPPTQNENLDLGAQLQAAFDRVGITDEVFREQSALAHN